MIDDILATPPPMKVTWPRQHGQRERDVRTTAAPQITYFPDVNGTEIKGNGNASGAGIMVVEGDLTIKGTLDFKGLILVRGKTNVAADTEVTGNATLYGSLWTSDINLNVGGSAIVYYSSQALALANQVIQFGALPAR
jgi:hypothetical protein